MPFCIECGTEISEQQAQQFNIMCPECDRIVQKKKSRKRKRLIIVYLSIFVPFILSLLLAWI